LGGEIHYDKAKEKRGKIEKKEERGKKKGKMKSKRHMNEKWGKLNQHGKFRTMEYIVIYRGRGTI
jgi:hypothetical protein